MKTKTQNKLKREKIKTVSRCE